MSHINTTIGVYANGDMKFNGVPDDKLEGHVQYNTTMRAGRALFVNGKCVHKGNLNDDLIALLERQFSSDSKYVLHKDTKPYQ